MVAQLVPLPIAFDMGSSTPTTAGDYSQIEGHDHNIGTVEIIVCNPREQLIALEPLQDLQLNLCLGIRRLSHRFPCRRGKV
jgi:hypothetical protein